MKTFGRKRGKNTGEWGQLTLFVVFTQCSRMKSSGVNMRLDKQDMHVTELVQDRSHQRSVAAADWFLRSLGVRTLFQLQNLYGYGVKWVSECGMWMWTKAVEAYLKVIFRYRLKWPIGIYRPGIWAEYVPNTRVQHYYSYYANRRSLSWSLYWFMWQC
jgi:hypothetical protein